MGAPSKEQTKPQEAKPQTPKGDEAKKPEPAPFTSGDRVLREGVVKSVKENGTVVVAWKGKNGSKQSAYGKKRAERILTVKKG